MNINHIFEQNSSSNNSDLQLKVDNRNKKIKGMYISLSKDKIEIFSRK